MVLDTARPKYKENTTWLGMWGRDALRKSTNILQVFTIDFSEIHFIVNHNSQSDGQNKNAKNGMTLRKKTTQTNSLQRKREDTKDSGILLWTKQAKMGLWSFDLILEPLSWWKIVLHHESGEPIEEPIHPSQQRRIRQGQEVFSEDYLSSARVDQHTGCQYWPSSPSSSWWYASEWSWKWAHIFFCSNLFLVTVWFRLHLITIHCNRRRVWTEHPHTAYFLALSDFFISSILVIILHVVGTAEHKNPCAHAEWGVLPRGDAKPSHRFWAQRDRQLRLLSDFCSDLPEWNRRQRHGAHVLVWRGPWRWDCRKSALFTTVHSGARRTSGPKTSLSLFWRKFVASSVLFAHTSTRRPVYEPSSDLSRKRKSSRDLENEQVRILLERQKKFSLNSDLRSRSTHFKPSLTEEVSRN